MKKIIFLAVAVASVARAQKCAVMNIKNNTVYCGLDNDLRVVAENTSCDKLVVSVDNGHITKDEYGSACDYHLNPTHTGIVSIIVAIKKQEKIKAIDTIYYRSILPPDPKAEISGKHGGKISLKVFRPQLGISVPMTNFEIDGRYRVLSFSMTVIRGGQQIFNASTNNELFSSEMTKMKVERLAIGDTVRIEHIHFRALDGSDRVVEPLAFTITE